MDKNRIKGKALQTEGKIREGIGKVFDDKSMTAEGKIKKAAGKAQEGYGKFKDEVRAVKQQRKERGH